MSVKLVSAWMIETAKQFELIQDTSRQLLGWILPDTVNTVKLLLMMGENIARNM